MIENSTSRERNASLPIYVFAQLLFALTIAGLALSAPAFANEEEPFAAEQLEFFEKEIRPLLAEHCYSCHSTQAEKNQAGLYLDSRKGLLTGGDSGAAILPGDSDSLFLEAIRYESYEMPPKGKLPDEQIAKFERWVEMGAAWPEEKAPEKDGNHDQFDLEARAAEHWTWQPVQDPEIPMVKDTGWPKADLDYFVLAELEKQQLEPAVPADRLAVLRRLYMDLIGLPPTPEQVQAFMNDPSPDATERVVDQLLESPHFGERWGRHWLDLMRYAESRGHEFDNDTPNAFQYRDYVIRALNADVPYDQLIREHIAGDLLAEPRMHPTKNFNESVLGTGFWFLGEWVHSPVDIRKDESDRFDNMLDVMSKAFLGVTVACARCHDHKFDAISTNDYYSLSGFLQSSDYRQVRFESLEQNRTVATKLAELDHAYNARLGQFLQSESLVGPKLQKSKIDSDAVVIDYHNCAETDFIQDGVIFGNCARIAGQLYFDEGGKVKVARNASAVNDPFWNDLNSITLGKIQNSSRVDALPKSGRTLRTPTFDLNHGTVTCFVAGRGHVVACVDSHRLVAGPLHGETIQEIKEGVTRVQLNLSRYIGHRLHLEFVPAEKAELSVQLVVQGMDRPQLDELESQLRERTKSFEAYADSVEKLLNGRSEETRRVFADFESGNYDQWHVEGDAFGEIPQTAATIASYQGDVNNRGQFFVNSHNIRSPGRDMVSGDKLTGTLTSPEFSIDFQSLEFLIGGGAHAGKTCVNLLIDNEVVLSTTGKNNNRMEPHAWDVRPYVGKRGRIQIVDNHEGGWGNIGADDFCFVTITEHPSVSEDVKHLIERWKLERDSLRAAVRWDSHLAPAMLDGSGEDDHVLIRGNSSKPGKVEPRHFLTAITGSEPMQIDVGSGRLQLADAINDAENPLTSRVAVNRIWHHLMGQGIVPTVDDFGVLGQRPTNLKLLDHLATEFDENGRSIKQMIRYIVLSNTYQMSSKSSPDAVAKDPNNTLWHHRPPQRLEGEIIRDSLLAISGRLDSSQFGPPVPIHLTSFMDGRGRPGVNGPLDGDGRRSVYISVRRNFLSPFMLAFDTPVPFSTMGRRNVSNVPAQALILMNDPFVLQQAEAWAKRVIETHQTTDERVRWMYLSAFARLPTEEELQIAIQFVGSLDSQAAQATTLESWTQLAHVLINTKEFIFLR